VSVVIGHALGEVFVAHRVMTGVFTPVCLAFAVITSEVPELSIMAMARVVGDFINTNTCVLARV